MGILSKLEKRNERPLKRRSFEAASVNRLTMDWGTTPFSADWDIRYTLRQLRARSRELASNNEYARKFIKMCVSNVIGPDGIMLRSTMKDKSGRPDKGNNQAVTDAWAEWGKRENCTVTGLMSWAELQRQVIETVARDGEIFLRIVRNFPNDFGFALQALEAEYMDVNLNRPGDNIRMAIEYDDWRKPVAYWVMASNIYDYQPPMHALKYIRYPASDVIHVYWQERAEQGRGVPWMTSAMINMQMLKGYKESELVSARVSAAKMGFLEPGDKGAEDAYTGDDQDTAGNTIIELEPGMIEQLPRGYKFSSFDPQHPTTQFDDFVKSCLRGISCGFLVSYNSLANDLEHVNYSSIRQGVIDERDMWRILQALMIEALCQRAFKSWLPMAAARGKIRIPMSKLDDSAIKWRPRGWDWVDPLKDQQAMVMAINTGLRSRKDILAEQGEDFYELMDEIADEQKYIKDKGVVINVTPTGTAGKFGASPEPKGPEDVMSNGKVKPVQQPGSQAEA